VSAASPRATFLDPADEAVRRDWADLLERSEQATPFSTLAYAEAVRDVLGLDYRLAGVYDNDSDGERLIGGVLCYEKPLGPYRRVVVPPLTAYTSFLFDPPLRETDINHRRSPLDALIELLEEHYHALSFLLHPSLRDVRAFQWAGWQVTPRYTQRLPLDTSTEVHAGWSSSTRRTFRKHDSSFPVETRASERTARQAADLCAASYARHDDTPPLPPERMAAFARRLQETGLVRFFRVRNQKVNEIEGALAALHDEDAAYYWLVGSRPGPAMTVLLGAALRELVGDGLSQFDFVGANTPSITEFKRRFGPELISYFRVEHATRPEMHLLDTVRRLR
jgi:hypothetical protein